MGRMDGLATQRDGKGPQHLYKKYLLGERQGVDALWPLGTGA